MSAEWDVERLRRIYDSPSVGEMSREDALYLADYLRAVDSFDIFDNREDAPVPTEEG